MLLMEKPAKAARLCGLTRLTDTLHGRWIREMVFGQEAMTLLNENREVLTAQTITCEEGVAKISIIGAGMTSNPGVAAKMFEALYAAHINIHMISTSEIKLSVLIDKEDSERAMRAVHAQFFQ